MEKLIERLIYQSRWLLAPIYLGLSFALLTLAVKFFIEIYHLLGHIMTISETDLILVVLTLIDLTMVGGLLVMVMFTGYENFVSTLTIHKNDEKLNWLGTMDSASLKARIAASIVAISSIHLLKVFMNAEETDNSKIMWYVIVHLTFVLSAFAMGFLDAILRRRGVEH